jgi:hypothetical protein
MTKYRYLTLMAVVVMTALGLVACGSESEDVPSLNGAVEAKEAEPTASASDKVLENEAMMMAFTQCLRDQGLDVLDPVVDADGNVQKPEMAEGVELGKKDWGPAWDSCAHHLEGFAFEKEEEDLSQQLDLWVDVTACLREKGYDLDEPTAETMEQWMGEFKTVLDWNDPDVEADFEECTGGAGSGRKGGK